MRIFKVRYYILAFILGLSSLHMASARDPFAIYSSDYEEEFLNDTPDLQIHQTEKKKKKILILSSKGGYGHTAAAQTIANLLGDRYETDLYYPIREMIPGGEEFYNNMLAWGMIQPMNFIALGIAPTFIRSQSEKTEEKILKKIREENFDMLISVMCFINYPASEAARKAEVPFLVITTDNNTKHWTYDFNKIIHPRFKITIGMDIPETRGFIEKKKIPSSSIYPIGQPLRLSFLEKIDRKEIRKKYGISNERKVILIMMGGTGGKLAKKYAKRLAKEDLNAHIIVCCGKKEGLKEKIAQILPSYSNVVTPLGFTQDIAELMALSDLLVTKPGPGTTNEAMQMQVPMMIDQTGSTLKWEEVNVEVIKKMGIGVVATHLKDVGELAKEALSPEKQEEFHHNFEALPRNEFHEKIVPIIEQMMEEGGGF